MAGRGNSLVDKDNLRDDTFDPNLRDEGAGFFSTLFTAGSNIGTDALTELGYLAQAVASPIDTGEAILRVAAGYAQKALPDSFEQYLPEDWATNKMYANAINDYYAEKYGSLEQAADSFAEQPVSVALDVFAVKALLTAVTKQAVTRSNATTKMAKTAEGTPFESELAARAAAELKVAQELERTVKYEGKLKYDEALGAFVPEAELAARTTLDAAEVAPIASAIDEAVPTLNNAPLSTEGMMAATRNKEVNPALVDNYEIWLNNPLMDEGLAINERGLGSIPPRLPDGSLDNARVTADDIAYYEMIKKAESVGDDFEGIGAYFSPEKLAALEVATGRSVLDNGTPNFKDADLPFESVPAATSGINLQGTRAADGSLMTAATRNQAQNPLELNEQVLGNQFRASEPVAFMDGTAQESIAATKAYNEAAIAAGKEPISYKGTTVAIADDLEQAAAQDLVKRNKAFEDNVLAARIAEVQQRTADANKLARDKQRMADDEIMAAATQADLFSTGTAAQYELAQASRIANDLAKVSPDVPAVVGTRMMAPTESTKLAKYADVERRTTPPSIPQTKLNVDIKKVVPAVQRVAAASSQQAERGADNSFLPMTPDRGIDLSEPFVPIVPERIDVEQPENTRPGWKLPHQFEGSTREGNYWSADFEDEHWNTPAGINEAMGIWGRPVGNRTVNPR